MRRLVIELGPRAFAATLSEDDWADVIVRMFAAGELGWQAARMDQGLR